LKYKSSYKDIVKFFSQKFYEEEISLTPVINAIKRIETCTKQNNASSAGSASSNLQVEAGRLSREDETEG
jgi:hypothetical protein